LKTIVARQPILNIKNETIAYEILFRSANNENYANFDDGNVATTEVLKNLLINFGVDKLSGGKKVFVNFTSELILEKFPELLKKDEVVIEILEDIYDSKEIIDSIRELKKSGYTFAIDDYILDERKNGILKYMDIVKVDFIEFTKEEIIETARVMRNKNKVLLAEKVETYEEFEFAKEHGFTMFQGYYFLKPEILESSSMTTLSSTYLQLIDELNQGEVSYVRLAEIAKNDVSLTYSLLNIVNSVAFYSRTKITSIKNALARLGLKESKKIIYYNFLRSMTPVGTPGELLVKSLIRAKQAEKLADEVGMHNEKDGLFLLGMFSLINIILKTDMISILKKIPLDEKIEDALLGKNNDFSEILAIIVLNEKNRMEDLEMLLNKKNISIDKFSEIYFDSIQWADSIFK
jgi:EAL and modified HD-GYP domain-containing signal transduction protein